jgi:hypothetical protein
VKQLDNVLVEGSVEVLVSVGEVKPVRENRRSGAPLAKIIDGG